MKLDPKALGAAVGVTWALAVFFLAILAMFGRGVAIVEAFSTLYVGYQATLFGAIMGAIWGFIDGFLGGAVIAWIYNKIAQK